MDKQLSQKLHNINATLVLMVVFIHAQNVNDRINGFEASPWNRNFQDFISSGLCFIAVPLFFMMSGFFFFREVMTLGDFVPLIKKRVKTLLVPYFIVSLLGICFFIFLQSVPFAKKYFNNQLDLAPLALLKTWLLFPLPYQLWFLRNLFVLSLLSPLIYWIVKKGRIYTICVLTLAWLLITDLLLHNLILCFWAFSFGAYCRIHRMELVSRHQMKPHSILFVLFWFAAVAVAMLVKLPGLDFVLSNLSIILGILAIWKIFDERFVSDIYGKPGVKYLKQFAFLVYLFHEPLLTIFIKILFSIGGISDFSSVIAYFLAPALSICLCVVIAISLKKYFIKGYQLVSGNR